MKDSYYLSASLAMLNGYETRLKDRKTKSDFKPIFREIHHRLKKLVLLHLSSDQYSKERDIRLYLTVQKFVFMGIY